MFGRRRSASISALEVADVVDLDAQHRVGLARHRDRADDLGDRRSTLSSTSRGDGAVGAVDLGDRLEAEAELADVDHRGVAADHAGGLEPVDAALHRGGREPDLAADVRERSASFLLQQRKDLAIQVAKPFHSCHGAERYALVACTRGRARVDLRHVRGGTALRTRDRGPRRRPGPPRRRPPRRGRPRVPPPAQRDRRRRAGLAPGRPDPAGSTTPSAEHEIWRTVSPRARPEARAARVPRLPRGQGARSRCRTTASRSSTRSRAASSR